MYQIYLLSILTNLLAGAALSAERMGSRLRIDAILNAESLQKSGFRLGLGLVAFVVGFLKLLSVSSGDVAVVGDLIPALAGMVMGFTLAFEYYRSRSEAQSSTASTIDSLVERYGSVLGIVGIVSALLHFLLPTVLFL